MDGDVASIPVRKSAVQQLQEQMKRELDDKEAEFSAFKEKTKKYIEQLKKKQDESNEQSKKEMEELQRQMARNQEEHAKELQTQENTHRKDLAARESSEGVNALKKLEAEKVSAVKALADAQTRLQAALGAASQIHVLRGELEQERLAKEAAQKELAKVRSSGGAGGAVLPSQISGAFSGFAGLSSAFTGGDPSTSIFGGSSDPSTSLFGSSAPKQQQNVDPSTSLFGSSAPKQQQNSDEQVQLETLKKRVKELEEALQKAQEQQDAQHETAAAVSASRGALHIDESMLKRAQDDATAARGEVVALQEKLQASLKKAVDCKRALEAENSTLSRQMSALELEVHELRQQRKDGRAADTEVGDDDGWGNGWGDAGGHGGGAGEQLGQLKTAEAEVSRLLRELEQAEARGKQLEEAVAARDEMMGANVERLQTLEEARRRHEDDAKRLTEEAAGGAAELEQVRKELEIAKAEADALQQQLQQLQQLQASVQRGGAEELERVRKELEIAKAEAGIAREEAGQQVW
jgi:chromosome segregation ATPase